ncbi:hypothetical protein SCLCIDRAFT_1224912 [Scleroderma citrinum Foug A]|uniref:Uncharacterized protein n=1 Tax=Scleroderma citrinum Foug A TaxID=1036808 RepID=A0A0C2YMN1_9AGAM|nr:hypothetical protein SCLCIDRAFT_1224912 [Scleroderma citrinum Foug A]
MALHLPNKSHCITSSQRSCHCSNRVGDRGRARIRSSRTMLLDTFPLMNSTLSKPRATASFHAPDLWAA